MAKAPTKERSATASTAKSPSVNPSANLRTIRDFIRWGASEFERNGLFYGHGMDNPYDESAFLVAHALALAPLVPDTYLDARLTMQECKDIVKLIEQRIKTRKPAAYLAGYTWFAGLRFEVNDKVLVPRSPMAELVANRFEPWLDAAKIERVLEIGTGSGCIAIALAHYLPEATVVACDISKDALAVARRNVDYHQMQKRVEVVESDLFSRIEGKFDLIITNPPYVPEAEWKALPKEYQHEPALGLCAGKTGMDIVDRLIKGAGDFLHEHGALMVEVGFSDEIVCERYPDTAFNWIQFDDGRRDVFILHREHF